MPLNGFRQIDDYDCHESFRCKLVNYDSQLNAVKYCFLWDPYEIFQSLWSHAGSYCRVQTWRCPPCCELSHVMQTLLAMLIGKLYQLVEVLVQQIVIRSYHRGCQTLKAGHGHQRTISGSVCLIVEQQVVCLLQHIGPRPTLQYCKVFLV